MFVPLEAEMDLIFGPFGVINGGQDIRWRQKAHMGIEPATLVMPEKIL